MGRRSGRDERTFAEVVDGVPEVFRSSGLVPLMNVALLSEFADDQGVVWRRRGESVQGKVLQRLVLDGDVRLLHDYLGETREVPSAEREQFWATAAERMGASQHANFYGAEFKNEERQHLLVVHEDC